MGMPGCLPGDNEWVCECVYMYAHLGSKRVCVCMCALLAQSVKGCVCVYREYTLCGRVCMCELTLGAEIEDV